MEPESIADGTNGDASSSRSSTADFWSEAAIVFTSVKQLQFCSRSRIVWTTTIGVKGKNECRLPSPGERVAELKKGEREST